MGFGVPPCVEASLGQTLEERGTAALVALPMAHGGPLATVALLVAAQSAALNTGCTASVAMTNHAVAAHPTAVGALNGVVVTVESVAKALGPALGAPLFAAAKARLQAQVRAGLIVAFASREYDAGHRCDHVNTFLHSTSAYEVEYEFGCEPYTVVPRAMAHAPRTLPRAPLPAVTSCCLSLSHGLWFALCWRS